VTPFADQLSELRSYRLSEFDLGSEFVYPHYAGRSILNIPDSICKLFGVPLLSNRSLAEGILPEASIGESTQNVILIVVDALALHRLIRWMEDGTAPVWNELAHNWHNPVTFTPLTSITPSTTAAALTSLWTGRSPTEHGITGYEMWMKEYGVVANTILHAPMNFRDDIGTLSKAGFDPQKYLQTGSHPFPTLGEHLATHDVSTFVLQHRSILRSGLSQMFFKDLSTQGFQNASDLWVNLRHLLENRRYQRTYYYVYWSEVDSFGHRYGPDDERTVAEFSSFSQSFERLFLSKLSPETRRNTLLILTADHGQITTQKDDHYQVQYHPAFWRRLHIQPTGENRLAFLYVRPGQMEAVSELVDRTWKNQFVQIDPVYAVENGLFGPGEPHPALLDRVGDTILLARERAYLWWGSIDNHLIGRHGGLHPEEMLIPFLAVYL